MTREYPDSWASAVRLYGSSHPHFFSRKIQDGHLGPPFLLEIHEEAGLDLGHKRDHPWRGMDLGRLV